MLHAQLPAWGCTLQQPSLMLPLPLSSAAATEELDDDEHRPRRRRRLEEAQAGLDDEELVRLLPALCLTASGTGRGCPALRGWATTRCCGSRPARAAAGAALRRPHWPPAPASCAARPARRGAQRFPPPPSTAPTRCPQGEVEINLDEARGPIREWIAQEPVRREIGRRFARLLKSFTDEGGDHVYRQRVRDMVRSECGRDAPAPAPALAWRARARRRETGLRAVCAGLGSRRAAAATAIASAAPPGVRPRAHVSPLRCPVLPCTAANSATLEVNYLDIANTMPVGGGGLG